LVPGPHVRVTVQDNGPGIPPDVLPRIFDPFFTTKAPGEGSGLGLSVAHGIVHAYGGAITVDSGWGRGAAFHIYLPALAGAEVAVTKAEPAAGAPPVEDPGRGEHILAVDDEETLIVVLVRFLEAAGYTCTGCTDPLAALRLFEAEPDRYAAVITDFSMPRMTGVELTRRMRAIRLELAVVLTSGYLRKEDRAAALAAGVAVCLEKPGDYRRIVPTLQGLLARK
jgi:CheY-like chemotaxis protein